MSLEFLKFWKKKELPREEFVELNKKSNENISKKIEKFAIKFIGFISGSDRSDFADPEWDLEEIRIAANSDSYIKISLQKYSQLIFKAGYFIMSVNDKAAEYVRGRFRLMSFSTGIPIDILFQEIADDLLKYSNVFLIKTRVDPSVLVGFNAKGVNGQKPVGAYFRADPTTITIKRDKHGTVQQYQQINGGQTKKFPASDVIHVYMDKEGDNAFGTPRLIGGLEDVKLLRKIEGNIIKLIYRFSMPLFQMKIGLPEPGMQASQKEIDEARYELEKMPSDGMLVTNERTAISAVGSEGVALDATGYLAYFEKRVFSALNMSDAMMGRGGTKQDADSMESQIHDTVRFVQRIIAIFIEATMINELLLEGGFNPIVSENDIVQFDFEEISNDTKVKMENHAMNQFAGNAITFAEMRSAIGKRADNIDENELYAKKIQQKNVLEQIYAKGETAKQVKGVVGIGGNGKETKNKTSGAVANVAQPENQHGRTSARIKESLKSANIESQKNKNINNYRKNYASVYKKYFEARNDICEKPKDAHIIIALTRNDIAKVLHEMAYVSAYDGAASAWEENSRKFYYADFINNRPVEKLVSETLDSLFKDISKRLAGENEPTKDKIQMLFDTMEYRLRFLCEFIMPKAYWFSYVKACQSLGIKQVFIDFHSDKHKGCKKAVVETDSFSIDDIPPFDAYCKCKVVLKEGEKE